MTDDKTATPDVLETPVAISLIHEIIERFPDWRITSHRTSAGRKVMMIEFADENGEFTSGLPGGFVEMVSNATVDDEEDASP